MKMIYGKHKYNIGILVALWIVNLVSTSYSGACNFPNNPSVVVEISKVESHPNNEKARNNKYVEQTAPRVEVLKDWKLRFSGSVEPAITGATYKWERKLSVGGDDSWGSMGTEMDVVSTEETPGDYVVRFSVTKDGYTCHSATKQVMVVSVKVDSFSVTGGDVYTIQDDKIVAPNVGINFNALVSKDQGPVPIAIKYGTIQGISSPNGDYQISKYNRTDFMWTVSSGPATANYYDYYTWERVMPADMVTDNNSSDADFYASTHKSLGQQYTESDTPSTPGGHNFIEPFYDGNSNEVAMALFKLDVSTYTYVQDFTLWLVVGNFLTSQYVPLKQQSWNCHKEASVTTWRCEKDGDPIDPTLGLPDKEPSSKDTQEKHKGPNKTRSYPVP